MAEPSAGVAEVTSRQVALASGAQLGAKGAHLLLNVASTLIVVRYLPEADFGEYVVVLSTVMLAGLVGEFGLPALAVREIVRRPDQRDEILGRSRQSAGADQRGGQGDDFQHRGLLDRVPGRRRASAASRGDSRRSR